MTIQSPLPPNQQLVAPGRWPTVGEKGPRDSDAPWTLTIAGLAEHPAVFKLEELRAMPQVERVIDIHCVTRWSKPGARFGGVPLTALLEVCRPLQEARFLSFVARSERNHSTSLPLTEALELDVLIALTYEGAPLEGLHGGPLRSIVPERYFYKSVKWLERIELLPEDRLGYWEAEAGYHNVADPWREQRYVAPNLDRPTVKRLIESRDFSGRDLLGLDASGRALEGLNAEGALLRDARFQRALLTGAHFDRANLSNAHLEGADLRGASFVEADVEGADLRGADLRGADFRGASLFGATFVGEDGETDGARIDATTRMDEEAIQKLTPVQEAFVRRSLRA